MSSMDSQSTNDRDRSEGHFELSDDTDSYVGTKRTKKSASIDDPDVGDTENVKKRPKYIRKAPGKRKPNYWRDYRRKRELAVQNCKSSNDLFLL